MSYTKNTKGLGNQIRKKKAQSQCTLHGLHRGFPRELKLSSSCLIAFPKAREVGNAMMTQRQAFLSILTSNIPQRFRMIHLQWHKYSYCLLCKAKYMRKIVFMPEFSRVFQDKDIFVLTQNFILSIEHCSWTLTKKYLDNQILRQQNWYQSQSNPTFVLPQVRPNERLHLCLNDGCSLLSKSTQNTSIIKCSSNEIEKNKTKHDDVNQIRAHKIDPIFFLTKILF